MPNHVTNKVYFKNTSLEQQKQIILENINDELSLDFSKTVPMPESLNIEEGTNTYIGVALIKKTNVKYFSYEEAQKRFDSYSKKEQEKIMELGQIAANNLDKYGVMSWYDFSTSSWGTKWNAYEFKIEELGFISKSDNFQEMFNNASSFDFTFQTAWSCPIQWLTKLSERYPDVAFEVHYADEDIGNNCGIFILINGEMTQPDTSEVNWNEFAFKLNYGDDVDPEPYGYDENWEYSDEVYENYERKQEIKRKLREFD